MSYALLDGGFFLYWLSKDMGMDTVRPVSKVGGSSDQGSVTSCCRGVYTPDLNRVKPFMKHNPDSTRVSKHSPVTETNGPILFQSLEEEKQKECRCWDSNVGLIARIDVATTEE